MKAKSKSKKKSKKKRNVEVVSGVAWYSRDQWDLLLSVASDRAVLEDTYDDWIRMAEKGLSTITRSGLKPVKIPIDVKELIDWCHQKGKPVDGQARSAFANMKLIEMNQQKGQQDSGEDRAT